MTKSKFDPERIFLAADNCKKVKSVVGPYCKTCYRWCEDNGKYSPVLISEDEKIDYREYIPAYTLEDLLGLLPTVMQIEKIDGHTYLTSEIPSLTDEEIYNPILYARESGQDTEYVVCYRGQDLRYDELEFVDKDPKKAVCKLILKVINGYGYTLIR